jgi:hypothetical protein
MQYIINISNMKGFREKHPVGRRFFVGEGREGVWMGWVFFPEKRGVEAWRRRGSECGGICWWNLDQRLSFALQNKKR